MSERWRIIEGDCVEAMRAMPECSVDAVVCDPPYMLGFMGKAWDTLTPGDVQHGHDRWAEQALRVLKPGGHLLAFGGTRTYHRLACAIEDAGFEIRDCLAWLYGSGFPKSLDVSKAIDKAAGAEREVLGPNPTYRDSEAARATQEKWNGAVLSGVVTAPATPDAERWQGWGTALKPAHEPVVLARKPLGGTVAANVLEHGTGALNVDGCRINPGEAVPGGGGLLGGASSRHEGWQRQAHLNGAASEPHTAGRWPANVCLDPEAAAMLDEQTGTQKSGTAVNRNREPGTMTSWMGTRASQVGEDVGYGDSGGASRFLYVAKASSAERNAGLDGFEKARKAQLQGALKDGELDDVSARYLSQPMANVHPTVKPIELMRWLVRLVTPPGGVVLDPFTGSGTTGAAAMLEGFRFVGCEREPEYAEIARARIQWWSEHPDGMKLVERLDAEREHAAKRDAGQIGLF
jgi:DNA modification methylase